MVNGLAAIRARIQHYAVAFGEPLCAGDLSRDPQQVTKQGTVALIGIGHGDNMLARRNQHVHRRLRIDVGKGVAQLVLENGGRGNASFNDLAE